MTAIEQSSIRQLAPRPPRRSRRILLTVGWVILMLAALTVTFFVSRYLTAGPEEYFPQQREVYLQRELALGIHVIGGILALLIGPFQFVGRLRRRFVTTHRILGGTYVASATALGVSGLILAPIAYTGLGAVLAFTLLDIAMLFTTWTAVRMIMAGRYGDHRRWMIRSYSLIMAGIMLRVWMPLYDLLAALGVVGFSSKRRTRLSPGSAGFPTSSSRSGSPASPPPRSQRRDPCGRHDFVLFLGRKRSGSSVHACAVEIRPNRCRRLRSVPLWLIEVGHFNVSVIVTPPARGPASRNRQAGRGNGRLVEPELETSAVWHGGASRVLGRRQHSPIGSW